MALKKKLREDKIEARIQDGSGNGRPPAVSSVWLVAGLTLMMVSLPAAYAQYPGHIDTTKKTRQSLRAIAVLEWTGRPGAPSASRIIPLSVFDGETYQPGGLYLARPEPLALEPGTEYILQQAGIPKGLYDVSTARDVQGYWFGYGAWRPLVPETAHNPQPSENMPHGPDRPTLQRGSAPESKPSLTPPSPETAIAGADPDRPHLSYRSYNSTDRQLESAKLTGIPSGLQQMIGVSDAADRESHPFDLSWSFSWSRPGEAAKIQTRMEALAQRALAPALPPARSPARSRSHLSSSAAAHRKPKTAPAATPLLLLTDEYFEAYALTHGKEATVVFSAQTAGASGMARYVTLIAQPDFYGVPQVIFQSVTDDENLDEQPRMRLVDAVDARANGRGDLIFELCSRHDRQFAIYEVAGGQVRQIFTTGPLPDANAS